VKFSYSFSVLRYVHDPVTKEFLNVGVVVYSGQARFLRAACDINYGRITRMFARIDGHRFRQMIRFLQDKLNSLGDQLPSELPFEPGLAIEALLGRVLPSDDSSFQFSSAGVGLASDLERVLGELYDRYVDRYSTPTDVPHRDDEEIWRVFREPLERRQLASRLSPKRIVAQNYEYEFEHAWKNGAWHLYEPVSFDLVEANSILEKANRWVGRATSLSDSKEKFHIHMLLGEPQDSSLRSAFVKARNILNKMPGQKEFVRESEAEDFAEEVAREISESRP
jgi:hypothetical protein